jgi:putative aldouronate transport system substrate-binding protein
MEDEMKNIRHLRFIGFAALFVVLGVRAFCGGSAQSSRSGAALAPDDGPYTRYSTPVTIRVARSLDSNFTYPAGDDADNNVWSRLYKDKLNIEVKAMWSVDSSQSATRMNTAIASGDYPDIITVNPADYVKYAESGVSTDITDLFDRYLSTGARELVNCDNGYALGAARLGGRLYGIPWIASPYDDVAILHFRQDWLDNLGLQVPVTIEDFVRVAEAFTNGDPDKNGKKDTYALALIGSGNLNDWFGGIEPFCEMVGAYPQPSGYSNNLGFVEEGRGGLKWGGETDKMKEALALLNDFYKKGYIAQDFGTHDGSKAQAEVATGKAGMYFSRMHGVMAIQNPFTSNIVSGLLPKKAEINATILPGTGGYGKAFLASSYYSAWVVSSKFKNPEAIFKIFNIGVDTLSDNATPEDFAKYFGNGSDSRYLLQPVLGNYPLANYIGYQKVSEAIRTGNLNGLNPVQLQNAEAIQRDYLNVTTVNDSNLAQYAAGYGVWHVFANLKGGYAAVDRAIKANALTPAGYGTGPTPTMASRASILSDLVTTSVIKIAYGEEQPAYWDTVITNWHRIGGDEVLADANKWYKAK